jgi:release factor glutamine methyltransferase
MKILRKMLKMKYIQVYNAAVKRIEAAGNSEAGLDCWYLMEKASGFTRADWLLKRMEEMPDEQVQSLEKLLKRLEKGEPVAYILGVQEFMGLKFFVNQDVLIPRQDTEHVTELAIAEAVKIYETKKSAVKILDMCTGSGCIAISVKKHLENKKVEALVTAVDISEKALSVASENAILNKVEVTFIKSDMFSEIRDKYDIIISNPPYIPKEQLCGLERKVIDYEPGTALYGGEDGLDFYKIIAEKSPVFLTPGGLLLLEIGFDQGVSVPKLLKAAGFKTAEVFKDYSGHDRVVRAGKD